MPEPEIQKSIDDLKQDFQDKFNELESRFVDHVHNNLDTNPVDFDDLVDVATISRIRKSFFKSTSESYLLSNSAAETTILSATLPGGTLSTDRSVYGRFATFMQSDAGAGRTIQFKVNYGTSNKTTSFTLPASATSAGHLEFYVVSQASASSQKLLIGFMGIAEGGATNLQSASSVNWNSEVAASSEDSSGDLTLSVTCELFAAASGHFVRIEGGFMKLI